MGLIQQDSFICLDCETTGLDPEKDQIIEIALIRFNFAGQIDSYETLIDPKMPIPEASTAIHHITDGMVQNKPKIAEILSSILSFIGKDLIIGHGISTDIAFLVNAAK